MNLNVVLRHELHALINRASADQLFTALHSPQSPIRDRFIRFLALSYADWLSTQNDIDDDDIKKEWKHALKMQPQNGFAFAQMMSGTGGDDFKKSQENKPYPDTTTETSLQSKTTTASHLEQNGSSLSPKAMGDQQPNGGMNANGHQLQLNEKLPMDGFKRLYTESDEVLKKQLTKIITNDKDFQNFDKDYLHSNNHDYNAQILNDPDNNLIDQITDSDKQVNDVTTPMSIEQENMRKYFEMLTNDQQQLLKSKLPLLSDITTLDKRNEILIKKLQLCATTFDFLTTNPLELKGIEKKKQMLTEILEYIARYSWYNEQILERCIKTISGNLFRALPRSGKNPDVEDEPFEDPAWAHLQLIYDLTLRLVINTDVDKKTMKKYLEGEFVDNVIELFASEDPREREYLKTILHRIYGRFMPLRALIRQSIANCCYRTIYEQYTVNFEYFDDIIDYNNGLIHNDGSMSLYDTLNNNQYQRPEKKKLKRMDKRYYQNSIRNENGIAEFLEIFCSIIHGFSIPVKKEHKDFLRNVLVPLHKCRKLEKFHEQLVACCVQFVFKDPSVAPVILGGLLKFWPIQSPTKEEMFIAEVVNVVNAMINHKNGFSWPENREICLSVIDTLVECMKSHHHSVAERALLVWGEDAIEILIDLDKKTIWPKIVEAFLDNKNHWNESLRECNEEAMDVFKVRDPQTFNRIREEYERKQKQQISSTSGGNNNNNDEAEKQKQQRRLDKWTKIRAMANKNNK